MTARHQPFTRQDEQQLFQDRSIAVQPTLDRTYYKIWGGLPGLEGRILEKALIQRADQFPPAPNSTPMSSSPSSKTPSTEPTRKAGPPLPWCRSS